MPQPPLLNGYPIIRFDGTNDKLATADFAVSQPYHFFTVVGHIATPVSTVVPINFDNHTASGVPCRLQILTAPSFRLPGDGLSGAQRTSVTNTWYLVEGLFNGTSSSLIINNGTAGTSADNFTGAVDGVVLGARFNDQFANVEFAEVALYNAQITDANLYGLRQYFRDRYALF